MHELDNALDNISRQEHVIRGRAELILVLHGLDVKVPELEARARALGVENVTVIQADRELTLGACMNLGVDAASGDLIAKMDDDNYYGQHYLTDLVGAFGYTDAGIVGKWAHYVWLRSTGAVVLRCGYAEHRYDRLVQGGSMLIKGDVARELRFGDLPRAVDTDFLERAREAGVLTYSADRFNYVSIRAADHRSHTWPIADTALMNRAGSLLFYGDPRPHVDV
jgi:glycosyltransferase involved in cell wall biosynthesis